ncbi:copper amine oxidase 1 [Cordyceps fumosorosea ARSEF 2679]|uniref:Amine oxidase n=1 Tax=Cordyceps fumosorosea (strain ARSEF 2679) TaxID=1081104 RepID=A0A167LCY1_CORFA|nr:copper amine oxidase 1 [Cordyceps fumosorosea ARSEF 2679]OAA52941.1 copper amine oxidase 1 [Cordyceps fumosorosea ARSEF 2679]
MSCPHTHSLAALSSDEIRLVSSIIRHARKRPLFLRNVFNLEPPKREMLPYLDAERAGFPDPAASTPPPRRARAQYDMIEEDGSRSYMESTVDVATGKETETRLLEQHQHTSFTVDEFQEFIDSALASPVFQRVVEELQLPPHWQVYIDPWPFGGSDVEPGNTRRLTQLFFFARGMTKNNDDVNHYPFPLPFCVVMDTATMEVLRVERTATGGHEDLEADFAV